MKKIEIIKDRPEQTIEMSALILKSAITDPKQAVLAKDKDGYLFFVVFDSGFYLLLGDAEDPEAEYTNLHLLADDYDLFLV